MKCNFGNKDRNLRIIVGLAALGAGAAKPMGPRGFSASSDRCAAMVPTLFAYPSQYR